jgi:hypothetical protein
VSSRPCKQTWVQQAAPPRPCKQTGALLLAPPCPPNSSRLVHTVAAPLRMVTSVTWLQQRAASSGALRSRQPAWHVACWSLPWQSQLQVMG